MICNEPISPVDKAAVMESLPERVRERHQQFYRCTGCDKVYWKGTHYREMMQQIQRLSGTSVRGEAGKPH
jgi:uncharacterized protein with PIN domain